MASSSGRGFGTCPHQDDDGRLFHIGRLLLDGGTCLLRQVFDRLIPPCDLPIVLAKEENNLRALLVKRILTRDMMVKLYPDKNTYGKSSDFDIPLLTLLFIHLCQLKAPPSSNNWRSMPVDSDRSLEADILRLRLYTNRIFIHAEDCSIPSNDFELVSASVCAIFYRLGGIHWKRKAETMLHDVLTESESLDLNRLKDVKETCLVVKEFCPTHKSKFDHSLEMTKDSSENAKKSDAKVYYIKGKVEKIEQICEKIDQIDQLHGEGKQSKESIKKLIDKADKMKGTWDSICPMYDKFEELEELGQVAFSEVVMVRHNRDSHTYAIKRSHMKFTQKAVLLEFEDVVQTLCRLSHKNIVQYRTSFHNDEGHFRVLKECCDKDLSACFHSKFDMTNYIKPRLIKIFTDIVAGLEYLHSKKIIHRDLKPANILLYSLHDKCDAKIGGFGLSCHGNQSVGSSRYWAPEQPSGKYDSKADMYSAGVILFELSKLEWGDPDDETDSWEKSLRDLRTNVRKQLKKYEPFYPKCVKWIIASLLQENPKKRLNTSQVLQELGRFSNKEYSYPMPEQCSGSPENPAITVTHNLTFPVTIQKIVCPGVNISDVNISDVNISYHDCTGMEHSDSDPIRERLASTREGAYIKDDFPMITGIPVKSKHHQMWKQFLAYIHEGKECEKTNDYLFVFNKEFRLGIGDHAQVFIGYSTALMIPVAVKQYKHDADDEVDFTHHLKLAVQYAQDLSEHTNIGRVLGSFFTEKDGYFRFHSVVNLYEEPLCAYLTEKKDHHTLMKLAVEFVKGLTFIHEKNIVHRNLKPQNIMVSLSGNVKVIDFNMSRMYIDPSRTTKMEEAPVWQAPEIVLLPYIRHTPSKEADVFSAVLLLFYTFANGRHPLCEKRKDERYDFDRYLDNIRSGTFIIQLEDYPLHEKLKESIGFNDPKIRPTADEILTYLERHEPTEKRSLMKLARA